MAVINTKLDANQVLKQAYDEPNQRLRVDAQVSATISDVRIEDSDGDELKVNSDGSLNVNLAGGSLDVEIDAADGDNIAISDGTNSLIVNPDGSINVVSNVTTLDPKNIYAEILGIASGVTTDILSFTATTDGILSLVSVSGTNIAEYMLEVNSVIQSKSRTYFGSSLDREIKFGDGFKFNIGDVIKIRVVHQRPSLGNFNTTISYKEI